MSEAEINEAKRLSAEDGETFKDWHWPLAVTPKEAERKRSEIAHALRGMAAAIDSGSFNFQAGDTFTITISKSTSMDFPFWDSP